jgi:hypothetical protein
MALDTVSVVIILLMAFLGYVEHIQWLFIGGLILFILVVRSIGLIALCLAGIAAVHFVPQLRDNWFIVLVVLVGLIILITSRKEEGGGGDMYSPELMQMLGGYGGH